MCSLSTARNICRRSGRWGAPTLRAATSPLAAIEAFRPDRAPQLPQDWPGISPYYRPNFGGTGESIEWPTVENLFFSLRGEDFTDKGSSPKGIEIEWVKAIYE